MNSFNGSSAADVISDARNKHNGTGILLLPQAPAIAAGVYTASCIEKVKILAPADRKIHNLNEKC